ncbi:biotin/lipoyl-binding protein [Paenibacillus sp. N1-5-1-14]|uniref:efflux RND transporter periplasmic adaptor subunit n=1 Tax=Paenibacillus radicibacter TaxID=2972488 RepID=UPI002158AC67|nr:HlyD family efflux transporter periplasmic adaptor subunit [Paenibacillus radicibacter]MCR8645955.1 biotin/lipoyl-binding protein [Paenibacillus radicibacter]
MHTGQYAEHGKRGYKRNLQIVSVIFIGILIFFTLFSNTLQSLSLPKAITIKPEFGRLEYTFEGSGTLRPLKEVGLTNSENLKATAVAVKKGDFVKDGQTLVTYDSKATEDELQDQLVQLEKQKLELQNLQDQYLVLAMEDDETKLRSVGREISTHKLDLSTLERKAKSLRERLAKQKQITAPFDGVVTKVNAIKGQASKGEPDVVIANSSEGYRLDMRVNATLLIPLEMTVGSKMQIDVRSPSSRQTNLLEGTIHEIADDTTREPSDGTSINTTAGVNEQKILTVHVADPGLKGGEQASVKHVMPLQQEGWIVANEAIRQEGGKKFFYKIEEKKGVLGNVFVVRKILIQSSETNGKETLVIASGGIGSDDLIMKESSQPVQDGNRVRLD